MKVFKQRKPSAKQNELFHPGYVPGVRPHPDCGCRPGHWCARHRAKAARDAGRLRQERGF